MKNLCFFLLVFCPLFLYAQQEELSGPAFDYKRDFKNILARTKDKQDTFYYLKLLNRFQENDSTLTPSETLALMIGYTDSRFFKPYANMQAELEIIKLNDKAFYLDVLDESKEYLRTHPLSLSINKERSFAYYMLKKRDSAKYYMKLADKIMEAMIYSGKGRTPETAFFSLGLVDGDYFIPNVGLSIWDKKTDVDRYRNYVYVIDAVSLEDVHKKYYFNIQHAKQKMDLEEDAERLAKEKKPKKRKGIHDPNAAGLDSLPLNPADSVILPLSERPKIDSGRIRDSLLRIRNISDSLRYDSIFIVCKNDSIKTAALEREKAIADSILALEQIKSRVDSLEKAVNAVTTADSIQVQLPPAIQNLEDSSRTIPSKEPEKIDSTPLVPTIALYSDSSLNKIERPEAEPDSVAPAKSSADSVVLATPIISEPSIDSTSASLKDTLDQSVPSQTNIPSMADSTMERTADSIDLPTPPNTEKEIKVSDQSPETNDENIPVKETDGTIPADQAEEQIKKTTNTDSLPTEKKSDQEISEKKNAD